MVATVILGMLCVHLLCFGLMFWLISKRLHGQKMGMEVFALGCVLLSAAYLLQLLGDPGEWGWMGLLNHTLTLCAPAAFVLGALRFFNRSTALWQPLALIAVVYSLAQALVQWNLGSAARQALLAASCSLLFLGLALAALHGARSFAQDLRIEMRTFAVLIGGICGLNAVKCVLILSAGLQALHMSQYFQTVFYIYMSFLGTVLPPTIIWLVLRRLTDELRGTAARDPLTQLLNRRGLVERLETHFHARNAGPAHLLMLDIDHFKQINDSYGHKVGDLVLSHVADVLRSCTRQGDLLCRMGGEEFVVVCVHADTAGALHVAERIRANIASRTILTVALHTQVQCTATIGISTPFMSALELEARLLEADTALYQGKAAGRNRIEIATLNSLDSDGKSDPPSITTVPAPT
jgi:diguanylate cyclase (GGDEF)-like protein